MLGDFEAAKRLVSSAVNMIDQFTSELAILHNISPSEARRGYEDFDLTLRLARYNEGKLHLNSDIAFPKQALVNNNPLI